RGLQLVEHAVRIEVLEQAGEWNRRSRVGHGGALGVRRIQATGKEIVLRQNLVVKDAETGPDRRLSTSKRIPRQTDPRRKILERGIRVPWFTLSDRGVGDIAKIRDFPVYFRRHGDELIAQSEVDSEVGLQADVVLCKESEQALAVTAVRVHVA